MHLAFSFSAISADLWRWCPGSQLHYSSNRWWHRGLQGQCQSHSSGHDSLHWLHTGALPPTGAYSDFVLSWISKAFCQYLLFFFFFCPTQINFPMCTIASMPRLPEHCVEYVRMLLWPKDKPFGGTLIHSICMGALLPVGAQPQTDTLVILLLSSLLIFHILMYFLQMVWH